MRPDLVSYVLMAGLLSTSPSLSDETAPYPAPPSAWRFMTHDDATTTSQCIGDFSDPFCTVETVIRCWLRGQRDFCASAYEQDYGDVWVFPKDQAMKYKFDSLNPMVGDEQAMDQRGGPIYDWQSGDIRIDVMLRYCHKDLCDEVGLGDISFFLRWTGLRWTILTSEDLSLPR